MSIVMNGNLNGSNAVDKKERIENRLENHKSRTDCDHEARVCGVALLWSEVMGFDAIMKKLRSELHSIFVRDFFDITPYAMEEAKAITEVMSILVSEGVDPVN